MGANFTRTIAISRLMLLVFALCFFQQRAGAQVPYSHRDLYKNIWVDSMGLAHGQTLLYTWANLNDANPQEREFQPLRIQVKLIAADGSAIAQAEAAAVGVGRSQSFAFNRDQINLPGEAGTGRLQVRLELGVQIQRRSLITTSTFDNCFDDAVEVIDNLSGRTTAAIRGGFAHDRNAVSGAFNFATSSVGTKHSLIGIVPGQTLRFTLFNPNEPDSRDEHRQPPVARLLVIQPDGRRIAESEEVSIPPGEFHSFDFNRSSLNLPGAPGTGRLQVRVVVEGTFTLTFTGQTTSVPLSGSWELVDNATGKTQVYNPATGGFFLKNTNTL